MDEDDADMDEIDAETYKLDADEQRLQQIEKVRATLAPVPEIQHPAPWRVAEAIVLAVNTFAGVNE